MPAKSREFTVSEQVALQFAGERLYHHKYLRINYTSYDLQRHQDSINLRTSPDILILADNSDDSSDSFDRPLSAKHPYLYARVLGIFHADIQWHRRVGSHDQIQIRQMDFLWIRWFIVDTRYPCTLGARRLPRLEFATDAEFDFMDPSDVLRGSQLIPSFAHGNSAGLGPSMIYANPDEPMDWNLHYVNM